MKVSATAKYVKVSPQKVRLVADQVRGKNAQEATDLLKITNKRASSPITKVILSAIANAENNYNLKKSGLVIDSLKIDQGPTLKRFQPRARGAANRVLHRTCHINVVLSGEDRIGSTKSQNDESQVKNNEKTQAEASKKSAKQAEAK